MTGGSEKQTSSRCSIVSRSSRRPDLPAGTRAGEVKEGRAPAARLVLDRTEHGGTLPQIETS
jgi:hypothetical protein